MSTSTAEHFDIAVIGTGSGNTIIDGSFADKKVAILEKSTFGGTCINVGCIPTKMFVYASEVAEVIADSARFGVDSHIDGVRWRDIVDRVFGRIDPIAESGMAYRRSGSPNVTLFTGAARFVGPRRLDTGTGVQITADQIVVATGSRPMIPATILDSGIAFHTNDDVMRLPELPEHLIVLGSGFIASEFAHVFSALGVRVTVLLRGRRFLKHLDDDISARFTEIAASRWNVRMDSGVTAAESTEGGGVRLTLTDGSALSGDALLVATGRTPNSDELDCAAAGIEIHPDGRIVVDEFGRTTASGVFALGDVSSPYMLKHVANAEARVVKHNLLRDSWSAEADTSELRANDHRYVPAGVFSSPQIASVGLTEAQARATEADVTVKVQNYSDVAYGWAMEDTEGFCKVIADRATGKLLGAHVMGAQATTVIQPLIQAMSFEQTARDIAQHQYWIHPGLPEVVENALLGLDFD